jgi:hypothetical protein
MTKSHKHYSELIDALIKKHMDDNNAVSPEEINAVIDECSGHFYCSPERFARLLCMIDDKSQDDDKFNACLKKAVTTHTFCSYAGLSQLWIAGLRRLWRKILKLLPELENQVSFTHEFCRHLAGLENNDNTMRAKKMPKTNAAFLVDFVKVALPFLSWEELTNVYDYGRTFFHAIASFPYARAVYKKIAPLVENWDLEDGNGRTALFYAARYSDLSTVRYLLSKSTNLDIRENVYNRDNLFSAALGQNCRFDVAKFFAKNLDTFFVEQKSSWISKESLKRATESLTCCEIRFPWKQVKKRVKLIYRLIDDKADAPSILLDSACWMDKSDHVLKITRFLLKQSELTANAAIMFQPRHVGLYIDTHLSYWERVKDTAAAQPECDPVRIQDYTPCGGKPMEELFETVEKLVKVTEWSNKTFWEVIERSYGHFFCRTELLQEFITKFCKGPAPAELGSHAFALMERFIKREKHCHFCGFVPEVCFLKQIRYLESIGIVWEELAPPPSIYVSEHSYKGDQNVIDYCLYNKCYDMATIFVLHGIDPSISKITEWCHYGKTLKNKMRKWLDDAKQLHEIKAQSTELKNELLTHLRYTPPSKLLPRGGQGYIESELEFAQTLAIAHRRPRHITPHVMARLAKGPCMISPKADGVPENIDVGNETWRAERITVDGKEHHLVFDTLTDDTWQQQMDHAKALWDETKPWTAKQVYQVHGPELLTCTSSPPETTYPNDGWIVEQGRQCHKVKPRCHLSIDLECRDNAWFTGESFEIGFIKSKAKHRDGVWRCYWENNAWTPKEYREDKSRGNSYHIVVQLTLEHRMPWNPQDFLTSESTMWYHKNRDVCPEFVSRETFSNCLNLGCGFKRHDGVNVDIDLAVLETNDLLMNMDIPWTVEVQAKHFGKVWHRVNLLELNPLKRTFDHVCMHLCISHLQTNQWLDEVNQRTKVGSQLHISFLDADTLPDTPIWFGGYGLIHKISDKEVRVRMPNTHHHSITECAVYGKELCALLKGNQWKLSKEHEPFHNRSILRPHYRKMLFVKC